MNEETITAADVAAMWSALTTDEEAQTEACSVSALLRSYADDDAENFQRLLAQYERGKTLLESYTVHVTRPRSTVPDWSAVPADALGAHVAESGHIATSQAYRILYARPRLPHGGARHGAGRHRLAADETKHVNITLPASLDEKAVVIGGGNRSEGIRKALSAYEAVDD